MIKNTGFYSKNIGTLPTGCRLCVKGRKSVLFITGVCGSNCYFCPISDKKKNKDVVYINEWPTYDIKEIVKEIKLCSSYGVGITGGDPLARLERTLRFIRILKKTFGKKFHIHLYTPLILANKERLEKLYNAGLDEIRFHPNLDDELLWGRIKLAKKFKWKLGVEIPSIPGKEKQTKKLIDFIKDKADFLNINELEVADNKSSKLAELGFKTKDRLSYAIKGSQEMALGLLRYCDKIRMNNAHYCTAKLKDKVQLSKRIKLRSKKAAKPYDIVSDEGMLFRGAIYLSGNLDNAVKKLKKEFGIPDELIEIDKRNKRILTASWIVSEIKRELKKKGLEIALVEEYPTWDMLEVSKTWL
jgi:pyruvate formate-lyase activating enzyme-like uncharacterized protein